MPCLSIIIPAYNEEKRIASSLAKVMVYMSNAYRSWEIILVDDGSVDRTSHVAREVIKDERLTIIKNPVNMGKGYSLKRGVLSSRGDVILLSDADLSTPIEELENMLRWIDKGYDVVIGSRALPDSNVTVPQPRYREMMGKIFNLLVRVFVIRGFKDTQCGFKCFRREPALKIFSLQKIRGFAFDVEVLLIAKRLVFKVKEVPVRWLNSAESKVHFVKGPLSMLKEIFLINLYRFMGHYKTGE